MEFEFDKEIDAILRKTSQPGDAAVMTGLGPHLDADELSMFAENAVPEKAKPRYVRHLADCDRCRIILTNTMALNRTAARESAVTAAEQGGREIVTAGLIPWYKKLFVKQNLAYGMGALALVFAGMLGFLVVQNALSPPNSDIAQVSENETSANLDTSRSETDSLKLVDDRNSDEPPQDADIAQDGTSSAPANLNLKEKNTDYNQPRGPNSGDYIVGRTGKDSTDGYWRDNKGNTPAEIQSDPADLKKRSSEPVGQERQDDLSDRQIVAETEQKSEVARSAPVSKTAPATAASRPAPPAGNRSGTLRAKNADAQKESREGEVDSVGAASKDEDEASVVRKLGGKTFTRKNRVWYDSQYRGQKTTNVNRKSSDYRFLDSGLRSIGDRLNGTVVLLWKSKAYRID